MDSGDLLKEIKEEVSDLLEDLEDLTAFVFTMAAKVVKGQEKSDAFLETWEEFYEGKPEENPFEEDEDDD